MGLVEQPAPDSDQLQWADGDLRNQLSGMELSLSHLEKSVGVMQREQVKYQLDSAEVAARVAFLADCKARLQSLAAKVNAPTTRAAVDRSVRAALLNSKAAVKKGSGDRYAKLDAAREAENDEFVRNSLRQAQALREQQEAGLDIVAGSVSNLKNMAQAINTNVAQSIQTLDELDDDVGRTQGRLVQQTQKIEKLLASVRDKKSLCTICLLVIVLITLLALIISTK